MKEQKLSKTKKLLLALIEHIEEQGEVWENFAISISHPFYKRTFMGGGTEAVRRRRQREAAYAHRQQLLTLQRQRWIAIRKKGEQLFITLTQKGKTIYLKEKMKHATPCKEGECIIVIFDIPEQERVLRRQLRHFLKECNFKQLQRSVWVNHRDVLTSLHEFIRDTKSNAWICAFRAHDITE